jgi:hypothetical protein
MAEAAASLHPDEMNQKCRRPSPVDKLAALRGNNAVFSIADKKNTENLCLSL